MAVEEFDARLRKRRGDRLDDLPVRRHPARGYVVHAVVEPVGQLEQGERATAFAHVHQVESVFGVRQATAGQGAEIELAARRGGVDQL